MYVILQKHIFIHNGQTIHAWLVFLSTILMIYVKKSLPTGQKEIIKIGQAKNDLHLFPFKM